MLNGSGTAVSHLRKARLRTVRPAYDPAGFCVANSMKCGCGRIVSCSSGTYSSRLSSSSLRSGPDLGPLLTCIALSKADVVVDGLTSAIMQGMQQASGGREQLSDVGC